jgi:hypothetical protein
MTGTTYEIDITMSADTVKKLHSGNYNLYGYKAVQAKQSGGSPVVWFTLPESDYLTSTTIKWSVQYQAYFSNSTIIPNGNVAASFPQDIGLGQTLQVVDPGIGQLMNGGTPDTISILNTTDAEYTCGIAQQPTNGPANPICAFPLYGQQLDVIAPIEKVLLAFSTVPVNTGTVVEQAYGPGVLIDLTSDNQRAVTFGIDGGWSWGGYGWATSVAANESLVPLLIENLA